MINKKSIYFTLFLSAANLTLQADSRYQEIGKSVLGYSLEILKDQALRFKHDLCLSALSDFNSVLLDCKRYCILYPNPPKESTDNFSTDNPMPLQDKDKNLLTLEQINHLKKQYVRYRMVHAALLTSCIGAAYAHDESVCAAGLIWTTRMIDQDMQDIKKLGKPELIADPKTYYDHSYNLVQKIRAQAYKHNNKLLDATWAIRMGVRAFDKDICLKLYNRTCSCVDCIKLLANIVRSIGQEKFTHKVKRNLIAPWVGKLHGRPDYNALTYQYAESILPAAIGSDPASPGGRCGSSTCLH